MEFAERVDKALKDERNSEFTECDYLHGSLCNETGRKSFIIGNSFCNVYLLYLFMNIYTVA